MDLMRLRRGCPSSVKGTTTRSNSKLKRNYDDVTSIDN